MYCDGANAYDGVTGNQTLLRLLSRKALDLRFRPKSSTTMHVNYLVRVFSFECCSRNYQNQKMDTYMICLICRIYKSNR